MNTKNKELLLKDLCARLPHEPVIEYVVKGISGNAHMTCKLDVSHIDELLQDSEDLVEIKPYLRPLSSMTEEEAEEYCNNVTDIGSGVDWLNKNMFDFRGLILKDLALSTDEFNPYKD